MGGGGGPPEEVSARATEAAWLWPGVPVLAAHGARRGLGAVYYGGCGPGGGGDLGEGIPGQGLNRVV
jgi:hypothetical protein